MGVASFKHKPHLKPLKEGKELRCTNCHTLSKERHMETDKDLCYLCHFREEKKDKRITDCERCHRLELTATVFRGKEEEHKGIKEWRLCKDCHTATLTKEKVGKERCVRCHEDRSSKLGEVSLLHQSHSTIRGIRCLECHSPFYLLESAIPKSARGKN